MATSARFQWPPPRSFVSAYAQNLMSADTTSSSFRIDGEMGLLAQIVDLENGTVLATIPSEDEPDTTEIITARISSFGG